MIEKTNILTPEYRLNTSSGKTLNTAKKYAFYHGKVRVQSGSKVTMIFYDDKLSISVFDEDGKFEINKQGNLYAGYYNHNRKIPINIDWDCQVIDESCVKLKTELHAGRSSLTPECVTIGLEIDHNMYDKHEGNIPNVEAWAMTLFSQVVILYIEHNVPINISGIQVWDTPDPYVSANNTSQALPLFRNAVHNNPNFNGRQAHLLSGRSLGGGIAYLNALCSTFTNVAVSANLCSGNTPYPTYSWNVMVVAHEMGHNMGSPHTQSCS